MKDKSRMLNLPNVDKTFNRIINSKSTLVPKEVLLKDLYSNYKDYFVPEKTLKKIKDKKDKYKARTKSNVNNKSKVEGVYFNSIKNFYTVLIKVDGVHTEHFGYFKSMKKAEEHCLKVKRELGLK